MNKLLDENGNLNEPIGPVWEVRYTVEYSVTIREKEMPPDFSIDDYVKKLERRRGYKNVSYGPVRAD